MWEKWIHWYETYKPDQISGDEQIIKNIHGYGQYRFLGVDREGYPIMVVRMKNEGKGVGTAD